MHTLGTQFSMKIMFLPAIIPSTLAGVLPQNRNLPRQEVGKMPQLSCVPHQQKDQSPLIRRSEKAVNYGTPVGNLLHTPPS